MDLGTVKTLRTTSLVVTIVLALLGKLFLNSARGLAVVCIVLGLASLVAYFIITLIYWKCPSCGMPLYHRMHSPKFCPHCGAPLDY